VDPVGMAVAFKLAVEAGRGGFCAGAQGPGQKAAASSPLTGFLSETSVADSH